MIGVLLTVSGLLGLLWAEWRSRPGVAAVAKPLASTGFLLAAWQWGAWGPGYGGWIVAGLVAAWLGDMALLSRRESWFKLGILAFLLGHVAYGVAFWLRGVDPVVLGLAGVALGIPAAVVLRWLWPHVSADLRGAVVAYVVVISAMVAAACATGWQQPSAPIMVGAIGFYLSDLSVARDRFVRLALVNRLWGLPLYYGAQLLLARSAMTDAPPLP